MNRSRRGFTLIELPAVRKGFTLIELLVVIGIILVLVGMAVVGYNQLDRTAAGKSTRLTLKNLQGLEAELDAEAGPGFIEGPTGAAGPAIYPIGGTLLQPGDVNPGSILPLGTTPTRFLAPIIGGSPSTQAVIGQLMRSVKNKQGILGLPSKQLMKDGNNNPFHPPVILDGWSDPIIFVPSGGLTGVQLTQVNGTGGATYTIRSSGVYSEPLSAQNHVLGPKDRPFWASAGQDGDFSKGDDNVYSFEN